MLFELFGVRTTTIDHHTKKQHLPFREIEFLLILCDRLFKSGSPLGFYTFVNYFL